MWMGLKSTSVTLNPDNKQQATQQGGRRRIHCDADHKLEQGYENLMRHLRGDGRATARARRDAARTLAEERSSMETCIHLTARTSPPTNAAESYCPSSQRLRAVRTASLMIATDEGLNKNPREMTSSGLS
jgi:hypothetical protein